MMSFAPKRRMGWLPDYPDFRDYTEDTEVIQDLLHPESVATSGGAATAASASAASRKRAATRAAAAAKAALPPAVDLRPWCSPVEDQGALGSCTAHAGVGIIEYYERKAFGRHTDASRLFLYKVTRNLMKARGDTGALLIRNSWGKSWGEDDYGWLPYEYVLKGLAEDFWTILKKEWIDTGLFAE